MGGMGGGMVIAGDSIVAPGMGFGMMPLVISGGKKGRNIIWGKRKRRSIAYILDK